jgi:hypothetical protein
MHVDSGVHMFTLLSDMHVDSGVHMFTLLSDMHVDSGVHIFTLLSDMHVDSGVHMFTLGLTTYDEGGWSSSRQKRERIDSRHSSHPMDFFSVAAM